jgi:ubiquinone biosynthesis protein COQ4
MNTATSAIDTRLHPLVAIRAVRALFANPEDTRQIFVIFRALRGRSGIRVFERFRASATGAHILSEQRDLLSVLEDRAYLRALPEGSVGRAYLAFMEAENLSAAGLVAASEAAYDETVPPEVDLFRKRMRDAHDLTHILTGYGRDALGETCLLAFMNRHSKNPGQLLIIAMGWLRMPAGARAAVLQGWRNGGKARWFQDLDYEALLDRPLEGMRAELGIRPPTRYREIAA